ncbi:MAG: RecB family exonuclease [Actinomycetes bacterium]
MTGDTGGVNGTAQLSLAGMPRRLYPCTPSRLTTWLDCPRRYRMAYLDRPAPAKGQPWAHNSLGAGVHAALAAWWRLPLARRTPEAAGGLVDTMWSADGFRDAQQAGRWQLRAREMTERYVSGLDPADEPVGVERVVSTRTETLAFTGRVDRLDLRPGGTTDGGLEAQPGTDPRTGSADPGEQVVVVDYKTGRRPLTADDARSSLALALYALAASRVLRRPARRVELHHLRSGKVAAWEHEPEGLARHVRRAEGIAAECRDADAAFRRGLPDGRVDEVFPAVPGAQCGWCDFARHCPEGRAARPLHRSWDGLGEDD